MPSARCGDVAAFTQACCGCPSVCLRGRVVQRGLQCTNPTMTAPYEAVRKVSLSLNNSEIFAVLSRQHSLGTGHLRTINISTLLCVHAVRWRGAREVHRPHDKAAMTAVHPKRSRSSPLLLLIIIIVAILFPGVVCTLHFPPVQPRFARLSLRHSCCLYKRPAKVLTEY